MIDQLMSSYVVIPKKPKKERKSETERKIKNDEGTLTVLEQKKLQLTDQKKYYFYFLLKL